MTENGCEVMNLLLTRNGERGMGLSQKVYAMGLFRMRDQKMTAQKTKLTLQVPKKSKKKTTPHPTKASTSISVVPPLPKNEPTRTISGAMIACCHCESISSQCSRRVFSEKAWSALISWNEVAHHVMNQPICEECYKEMRAILMDRSDELDVMVDPERYGRVQDSKAS